MMKPLLCFLLTVLSYAVHAQPCFPDSSIRVVVLGSSTAAGVGASVADSAWVNRYRVYLQSLHPNNEVVNLGVSATTTYQIMPDGFVPPPLRPAPDTNNNITKAIELQADAIIVNMPSNDAFFGIGTTEQMSNFKAIAQQADSAGIPIWVATTQPRNLLPAQVLVQLAVRDSIFSYFGNFAIDFWTTLAGADNLPNPVYNSGDGIHLNDTGHRILFGRVAQKNIPTQIMDTCAALGINEFQQAMRVFPNPSSGNFTINLENISADVMEITLYSVSGKPVYRMRNTESKNSVQLPASVPSGFYLLRVTTASSTLQEQIIVLK